MTTNRRSFLRSCIAAPIAALAAFEKPAGRLWIAHCNRVLSKAVFTLAQFEVTSVRVQQQLQRMSALFAGPDIARQAQRACFAVRNIGGSDGLTPAERERLAMVIGHYL